MIYFVKTGGIGMKHIKEIINYQDMIRSLVKRELRGKYEKSVLGFLWSFLSPMFQILIYNLVFTQVFHNDMPVFYMFLMTGILPWTFFSDSLGQGSGAIIYNAEMVKKIYFPREVLVIAEVNAKLVNMLLSFIVMAVFLIISRIGFSVQLIYLPLLIFTEYLLALGFAFLFASITVYFRDMEYIVNVILMAWIWATPVMYSLESVGSPALHRLLMINPMTTVISNFHYVFYYHTNPSVWDLTYPLICGAIILVLGYLVFQKLNKRFVEEL